MEVKREVGGASSQLTPRPSGRLSAMLSGDENNTGDRLPSGAGARNGSRRG